MLIGFVSDNLLAVRQLLRFPDPVNETSARLVAAGVVAQGVALLVLREWWLLVPLTYGFLARVLTGPTLSPLGQFVTRVASPLVEARTGRAPRFVPGPPKRFAQGVGLAFTASASVAWLLGAPGVSVVLVGALVAAATLESVFAVCLGCIAHSALWGCADCDDISERLRQAVIRSQQEVGDVSPVSASPAVSGAGSSPAVSRAGSSPAMH